MKSTNIWNIFTEIMFTEKHIFKSKFEVMAVETVWDLCDRGRLLYQKQGRNVRSRPGST